MSTTRDKLVKKRQRHWRQLEELLKQAEGPTGAKRLGPSGISDLARLYRGMASDLMLVKRDKLGADLERHLDSLTSRAHNALYAGSTVGNRQPIGHLILDFPGALRRNGRFFVLALVLFFGPGLVAGYASYVDETYALQVMSPAQLEQMEQMHSKGHDKGRSESQDTMMTGFYVFNNVGIAFRCFATGVLFGLGPLFYLLFNGLMMGVVFGHLIRSGQGENIISFVSSHGPWELVAIVISGAAGMQMGWALVSTKGRTRLGNLVAHGMELLRQIAGAAVFLLLAALLEAWYSPSSLPAMVKYLTGGVGWVLVFGLILFYGRKRRLPPDVLELRQHQTRSFGAEI